MARPFDFKNPVQGQTRLRQQGLCACCGELLDDLVEHAHHVVPNQSGNPRNPNHGWLSSVQNCVVLCAECHGRVHDNGRYAKGAIAPPSYYSYSHGKNSAAHRAWVEEMKIREKSVWA
jgi:hypothetical protein